MPFAAALALQAAAQLPPVSDGGGATEVTTLTARVEAIDYASRVLAVKGPLGRIVALKVDDRVKNLGKVKAGEEIVVRYAEAVMIALTKGDSAPSASVAMSAPGASVAMGAATAPPSGARPGAATAPPTKITARVEQIDPQRQIVLLEGAQARYAEVKVKDPGLLGELKVGDTVSVTYAEAVVFDVVTPKK